ECDLAETCDGVTTACPTDAFKASGTTCTDDGNACTTDVCNGTSATCTHPAGNAGAVCRAAASECDVAESCPGTSTTCPTDVFQASGTACTDDGDPCTIDVCSGTSAACTHPAGNAGVVCRAAANECDVAETCPGAISIGFRGATSASSGSAGSATSLSISRPAATVANDVMVASITSRTGSG